MQNAVTWIFSMIEYGLVKSAAWLELAYEIISKNLGEWEQITHPKCENSGRKMKENNINADHIKNPSDLPPVVNDKMQPRVQHKGLPSNHGIPAYGNQCHRNIIVCPHLENFMRNAS